MDNTVEQINVSKKQSVGKEVYCEEHTFYWRPNNCLLWSRRRDGISKSFTLKGPENSYEYGWTLTMSNNESGWDFRLTQTTVKERNRAEKTIMISATLETCRRSKPFCQLIVHPDVIKNISSKMSETNVNITVPTDSKKFVPNECNMHIFEMFIIRFKIYWKENLKCDVLQTLCKDFERLYVGQESTDVTFIFNNQIEIKAHKLILTARCSVFRKMFECDMSESKTNRVQIDDVDPDTFGILLRYIYTGKVDFSNNNIIDIIADLIMLAEKYDIKELKDYFDKEGVRYLKIENAAELLIIAQLFSLQHLKNAVSNFILRSKDEVTKTVGYQELRKNHIDLILELFNL